MEKKIKEMVRFLNIFAPAYTRYRLDGLQVKRAVFMAQEHWELVDDQVMTLEEARQELLSLTGSMLRELSSAVALLLGELPYLKHISASDLKG